MKNTEKLMILISVVLVSLLAIGAVSAADADATAIGDDSTAESTVEPAPEPPVAEPEAIEKPTVTESAGTFQKLDDEIVAGQINHKGNVTLDKDYKNTDGHGIEIKPETDNKGEVHKIVNLDGQDHIIDGDYNQTMFTINTNMTVTMKNLIFINGNGKKAGAILNYGNLTLINVTFMDNWGTDIGGAITNSKYGNLTIINATFIGNGAGSQTTKRGYGGAIFNTQHGYLSITNATFSDNSAIFGGAIYNDATSSGRLLDLELDHVGFFDNFADEDGGAIYNAKAFITALDSLVFDGNSADGYGGAICLAGDFIDVLQNAWFIDNSAGIKGGAIYTADAAMLLNKTHFYNNIVNASSIEEETPEGGAIYGYDLVVMITDSDFEENIATNALGEAGNGGAIYASRVMINASEFTLNTATKEGGAIKANAIYANNTAFENNAAEYGGAIYIGLYDSYSSDLSLIEKACFEDNAAKYGGAIYTNNELYVNETEFDGNSATKGGAIYTDDSLTIESSDFEENGEDTDYSYGGAIYISQYGKLTTLGTKKNPNTFVNDVAAKGSEIYNAGNGEIGESIVNYANVVNIDGEESFVNVNWDPETVIFLTVTSLDFEVVNNETGSVGIIVYLINENALKAGKENYLIYGKPVTIDIMDENEKLVVDGDTYIIGTIYTPEFANGLLANGTYSIFIEYEGTKSIYGSELVDEFEVVNMTAVFEELESEGYKEGYEDGSIDTERYYENDKIPKIEAEYEAQLDAKNKTIEDLEHQNDVLVEGNFLLNATNQNLTAENKKLATEKDDANKALAAKNAEATQLTADKTNLQNQVNTLQGQVDTLKQQNTEANAKISKVKAASKVKKSKNFKITVTLSDTKVNGKYVYVSFNGKLYKAKVKNGVAKITIKKSALKKLGGKTVKYQIIYDQSAKNKSVKIKK